MKSSVLTLIFGAAFAVLLGVTLLMPAAAETIVAETVQFDPEYMDLDNPDEMISVMIRFKSKVDYRVLEIDATTVLLDGHLPIISGSNSTSTKPFEWMADFDGYAIRDIIWAKIYHNGMPPNPQGNYVVALIITGNLYDGTPFTGTGNIKVKGGHSSPPPPPPP